MSVHDFTIVLPSNSSLSFFPNNTTTNFSTRLPREVELNGKWLVALSELHFPCTTLHLRREDTLLSPPTAAKPHYFKHGTYKSLESLIQEINESLSNYHNKQGCEKLHYDENGGFVTHRFYFINPLNHECESSVFSEPLKRILGYDQNYSRFLHGWKHVAEQPASLARAVPDQLFVYSNLCEQSIVGDTHAPLLRIVNINAKEFSFGCTVVKKVAPVNYIPLLTQRFQIIDIEIRDQFGKSIPFEFGTLTILLHFKREY